MPRNLQREGTKSSEIDSSNTFSDAVFLTSVGQVARIVKDIHVPEEIAQDQGIINSYLTHLFYYTCAVYLLKRDI